MLKQWQLCTPTKLGLTIPGLKTIKHTGLHSISIQYAMAKTINHNSILSFSAGHFGTVNSASQQVGTNRTNQKTNRPSISMFPTTDI